jgi:RNase adaptor protein for sRNA GlmZ degradation
VLSEAKQSGCRNVNIGVNCELGRHRSVAFVEELGHVKWDGWETVLEHRDLNAPRVHRAKRRGYVDRESRVDEGI